jgi:hypothetical protein
VYKPEDYCMGEMKLFHRVLQAYFTTYKENSTSIAYTDVTGVASLEWWRRTLILPMKQVSDM